MNNVNHWARSLQHTCPVPTRNRQTENKTAPVYNDNLTREVSDGWLQKSEG